MDVFPKSPVWILPAINEHNSGPDQNCVDQTWTVWFGPCGCRVLSLWPLCEGLCVDSCMEPIDPSHWLIRTESHAALSVWCSVLTLIRFLLKSLWCHHHFVRVTDGVMWCHRWTSTAEPDASSTLNISNTFNVWISLHTLFLCSLEAVSSSHTQNKFCRISWRLSEVDLGHFGFQMSELYFIYLSFDFLS